MASNISPVPEEKLRKPGRPWWDRSLRGVGGVCAVAFLIHLIPLFLPRNMPEQELAIARAIPESAKRVSILKPLKTNEKATGAELREAAELLREGAPLEAYELAKEAERREPGAVETQLVLARVCNGQRMARCEEEAFAKAEKLAPGDARASLLRADLREREGDVGGALEAVRKAYEREPASAGVGVRYARLLSAVGRGDEAVEVLKGLEGVVGRGRLLVEEGLVRVEQGRMEEARELFGRAVEAEPKLVMGHYHLGRAAYEVGNVRAAEEALREADRLDMSDMRALSALCEIQRRSGQRDAMLATRMDLERRFPERMEAVRTACRAD